MYKPNFRCKKSGVPVLSNEEIEQDAEMFIKDFDPELLTYPDEVDIDKFSEFYLGLKVSIYSLSSYGGILGRMIFNDHDRIPIYLPKEKCADYYTAERREILIDETLENDEHRIRSTMGHEAAHWIYHQAYFSSDPNQMTLFSEMGRSATACRKSDIEGTGPKRLVTDNDWLEHQANYFSAALLMPRPAMKLVCEDPGLRLEIYQDFPDRTLDMMAALVAETFNVSEEAARIRIRQLDLDIKKEETTYSLLLAMSCS